ncbi:MAG: BamA/TamA family outer membrane protein [Candidatus Alcyoniella australis]|nr:BamA/TamA family outer membrane protein [Candidatus Alcyoniella australis]
MRVRSISFTGNKKTKPDTFLRYFDTQVGVPYDPAVLQADCDRVMSWMFYEYVKPAVQIDGDQVDVTVDVKEKWTVQPVIEPAFGGGVFSIRLGLQDSNLLGRRKKLKVDGGYRQQDWLARVQYIDQKIGRTPFGIYLKCGREFYEDPLYDARHETELLYVYTVDQLNGLARLEYEAFEPFRVGVYYRWQRHEFDTSTSSPEDQPPDNFQWDVSQGYTSAGMGLWVKAGRVLIDNYIYRGWSFEGTAEAYDPFFGSWERFFKVVGDLRGYIPLGSRFNLCGKLYAGTENSTTLVEQFPLGGYDNLRALLDRQYRGRNLLVSNTEFRAILFSWWWITVEADLFVDSGTGWDYYVNEREIINATRGSAGAGVRFIVNKFDNAISRIDVGYPLSGEGNVGLTFGVDMYF